MPDPRQVNGDYDWGAILRLLQDSFAYMEGRIDPPSSLHSMSAQDIAQFAKKNVVVVIERGSAAVACAFLSKKPNSIYLGKLAVGDAYRGQGYARRLVNYAEKIARENGCRQLELQTRIELVENHAAFAKLGFVKIGEGRHPGFDTITEITMRKVVSK